MLSFSLLLLEEVIVCVQPPNASQLGVVQAGKAQF